MLQPRNLLPHFEVADLGGKRFQYSSIWQRKNLALVILPDSDPQSRHYADRLMAKVRGLKVTRGGAKWKRLPGAAAYTVQVKLRGGRTVVKHVRRPQVAFRGKARVTVRAISPSGITGAPVRG